MVEIAQKPNGNISEYFDLLSAYIMEVLSSQRNTEELLKIIENAILQAMTHDEETIPLWVKSIHTKFEIEDCYEDIDPNYSIENLKKEIKNVILDFF